MIRSISTTTTTTSTIKNVAVLVIVIITTLSTITTISTSNVVNASVFMPYTSSSSSSSSFRSRGNSIKIPHHQEVSKQRNYNKEQFIDIRLALRRQRQQRQRQQSSTTSSTTTAMAIPGYGITEQIFVGGFGNFLNIYNLVITARILLSWFPQSASIGVLQPIYTITDPYLNLFRNIIPPLFGLDFSPILAFFLLNVLTNATAAVGMDLLPSTTSSSSSSSSSSSTVSLPSSKWYHRHHHFYYRPNHATTATRNKAATSFL